MEEIIIFSKDAEEYIHHVDERITKLGEGGVTINLRNCLFCSDFIAYLIHIIKLNQLEINHSNPKTTGTQKSDQKTKSIFIR